MNPFAKEAISEPVVTVTVRTPMPAFASMSSPAVALVEDVTVKDVTVVPGPKLTTVVPWTQCVNCPVKMTLRFC